MAEGLPPQDEPVRVPTEPALTPFERAARGDLAAQREMLMQCLSVWGKEGFVQEEVAQCAEFWGRLAKAHGEEEDTARMLDVLSIGIKVAEAKGLTARAEVLSAESIALVDALADKNTEIGELAGAKLEWLVADCSPGVVELAKRMKGVLTC